MFKRNRQTVSERTLLKSLPLPSFYRQPIVAVRFAAVSVDADENNTTVRTMQGQRAASTLADASYCDARLCVSNKFKSIEEAEARSMCD